MGKDIKVYAFDDLDGKDTEATHTDVRLAWGKDEVTLDLSAYNYNSIEDFLRRYIKVGTRPGHVNSGSKRGRKPDAYYRGLHAFATSRGVKPGPTKNYPIELRREYEASLAKETA